MFFLSRRRFVRTPVRLMYMPLVGMVCSVSPVYSVCFMNSSALRLRPYKTDYVSVSWFCHLHLQPHGSTAANAIGRVMLSFGRAMLPRHFDCRCYSIFRCLVTVRIIACHNALILPFMARVPRRGILLCSIPELSVLIEIYPYW